MPLFPAADKSLSVFLSAILRERFGPRQHFIQKLHAVSVTVLKNLRKKVLKVNMWTQPICLGCLDQTVDGCTCLGTADRIDHAPVVMSDTEAAKRAFGCIIVKRDVPIVKESRELVNGKSSVPII